MAKLFANSGDPDQTPRSAASDLGLPCLPVTLLRVSRLQWVNEYSQYTNVRFCGEIRKNIYLHIPLRIVYYKMKMAEAANNILSLIFSLKIKLKS